MLQVSGKETLHTMFEYRNMEDFLMRGECMVLSSTRYSSKSTSELTGYCVLIQLSPHPCQPKTQLCLQPSGRQFSWQCCGKKICGSLCLFLSVASYCSFQLSAKSHQMTLGHDNQLLEALQFARNSETWDMFQYSKSTHCQVFRMASPGMKTTNKHISISEFKI